MFSQLINTTLCHYIFLSEPHTLVGELDERKLTRAHNLPKTALSQLTAWCVSDRLLSLFLPLTVKLKVCLPAKCSGWWDKPGLTHQVVKPAVAKAIERYLLILFHRKHLVSRQSTGWMSKPFNRHSRTVLIS